MRQGAWAPNKEQNGANENGKKGLKWGLSFIKIPLVNPSLDQKEQNCFGHPQFYSSIAPMTSTTLGLDPLSSSQPQTN